VDEYRRVCGLLDSLSKREQDFSLQFTPESPRVKEVRAQIAVSEKAKKKLEDENPGLLAVKALDPRFLGPGSDHTAASSAALSPQTSLIAEMARIAGLESRLRALTNQVEIVRREANVVADAEGSITALERQQRLEETNYNYFQSHLEELRADEQLGASRNSNIVPIQTASPPFRAPSKLLKAVAGLLLGSIAGAFALAFALEFYLDPSVKRPIEVESRLHLPLFLSIPRLHLKSKVSRRALDAPRTPLLPEQTADSATPALDASASHPATRASLPILPWDPRHALRPFQDALRDRLIAHFDLKNLTRKPKLVALTSCGEGCGVTTIAAGLAASLSETGDGNVLFVDMNEQGSAHQFYRGNPACGLEDALALERRDTALVHEKLYVVRENQSSDLLPRSVPKHFQHLVPKLKASDYDYIIFDMPPISQVSVTAKLARFMDISLVVVEAEETDREAVKRASSFLAQSGANVGVVLNKTRTYGPKRLQQEL
jgi:Mrp family chromosome partitioning ATPase